MNSFDYHFDTMKEVIEQIGGATIRYKKNSKLKYQIYLTKTMEETPIEVLNLSTRPFNCLKRAGYNTVGQVVCALHDGADLKNIRSCGAQSIAEIMQKLFLFQYYSLDVNKREQYLFDTIELNKKHLPE